MEEQPSTWQVGAWVRIYGSLRRIEDEVSIVSYHIRPIASWTEVILFPPPDITLTNLPAKSNTRCLPQCMQSCSSTANCNVLLT